MTLNLDQKIDWTLKVFDSLSREKDYILAFSGGKDSHVLLGNYIAWVENNQKLPRLKVVFSDTLLETEKLYNLINNIESVCVNKGIEFVKVKPDISKNYWVGQFGFGYPVPNYRARWCTKFLKVEPMQKSKGIGITGVHYGESTKRNNKIDKCGSSECGINDLTKTIEPLSIWRNCDIWDWIILNSDNLLYKGASTSLLDMYKISEDTNGSLRMGCFMCPVVSQKTIKSNVEQSIVPLFSIEVRQILENLRLEPRINSARTKKAGAIYIESRIKQWNLLKRFFPEMIELGWISTDIINLVETMLGNKTYPKTYKQDWINSEENRIRRLMYQNQNL